MATHAQQRHGFDFLLQAAEQGLAAAQNALGDWYLKGAPVAAIAADTEQALHWYRRAAAQGSLQAIVALEQWELAGGRRGSARNPAARRKASQERRRPPDNWLEMAETGDADTRYHLGVILEMGYGAPADLAQAQHWYRSAAQQGDARAQLALARLLEAGGAFEALDWYRKSAEHGNADAQFALARNLSSGGLIALDSLAGLDWYLRAAAQGHAAALLTVGSLLDGDMGHVAQRCYQQAAALGVAQAQYAVAEELLKAGGPDDLASAARWLELAARQGHAAAQCTLGLLLLEGKGVARDAKAALAWLTQAAQQGDAKAQWNLGSLYASGHAPAALERDVNHALHWCHQAAGQGFAAAQATLGALYARLERWPQAQDWLQRAADQDDPEALFNLAILGMQEKFQELSAQQALTYLNRAADKGVVPAQSRLGLAFAKGDGAALDAIEAHKWFLIASQGGDRAAMANLAHSENLMAQAPLQEALRRAGEWSKERNV